MTTPTFPRIETKTTIIERRASVANAEATGSGISTKESKSEGTSLPQLVDQPLDLVKPERKLTGDVQQYMNIHHFEQLMHIFQQHAKQKGVDGFDIETFREVFGKVLGGSLNYDQMAQLFMKIDANSDGAVSWDEFSTFVMVGGMDQSAFKPIIDERNRKLVDSSHKDLIKLIDYLPKERKYLSLSRDGSVCFWSRKLKLQRSLTAKDFGGNTQAWVTHAVCLHDQNKMAIITDDRQLCVYEMMSIKPRKLIAIAPLDNNPLCITYAPKYDDDERSALLFGDDGGYVNYLTFTRRFFVDHISESETRVVKPALLSPKEDNIFTNSMNLHRRKIHNNWVERIQYYKDINSFVTCSTESTRSLVIWDLERKNTRYIHVHKGIRCFDFCRRPSFIVTGGRDKLIRVWNPYVLSKCAGTLSGHLTTVTEIIVNQSDGHIISLSEDKVIRIWNIRNLTCLQTMTDKFPHRPENIISSIFFDEPNRQLITGSNKLESWPLYSSFKNSLVRSHDAPVVAAMFNQNFHQVVSGCQGSTISVWDVFTGQRLFQFHKVHENLEITAMCFDKSCRRLITASQDGNIKIWNFNNGQLLRKLVKKTTAVVSALLYAEVATNRYIVSVGWDRRVSVFLDNPNDQQTIPLREMFDDGINGHRGHQDDILSAAFAPPNMLVTGGADGVICTWNLETGSLKLQMRDPHLEDCEVEGRAIEALYFLYDRNFRNYPRLYRYPLVSCSSDGVIRFWNVYDNQVIHEITGELSDGGSLGRVRILQLKNFAIKSDGQTDYSENCKLGNVWKAHTLAVTSVGYVEMHDMVLSTSKDATIRAWTLTGDHIGVFGQESAWDLSLPSTFMPVPYDVRQEHLLERKNETLLEAHRARLREDLSKAAIANDFTMTPELEAAWANYKSMEANMDPKDEEMMKKLKSLHAELVAKMNLALTSNQSQIAKRQQNLLNIQYRVIQQWRNFIKQRKLTRDFRVDKELIGIRNAKEFFSYSVDKQPKSTKPTVRIGDVKPETVYKELVKHTQYELEDINPPAHPLLHAKRDHHSVLSTQGKLAKHNWSSSSIDSVVHASPTSHANTRGSSPGAHGNSSSTHGMYSGMAGPSTGGGAKRTAGSHAFGR